MAMDTMFENVRALASPNVVVALLLTSAAILIGWRFTHVDFDPCEPPVIPHLFPFVGHVVGMIWHGAKYFEMITEKYHYPPIFTLQTLSSRTYIVTSPALAAIVQRSSKSWSFYAGTVEFSRRFAALDEPTMKIFMHNLNGGAGDPGVMPETHDMTTRVLGPGAALDKVTEIQLNQLANILNDTVVAGSGAVVVEMHDWLRRLFSLSNAFAIYGPDNPFEMHPELVDSFWEFEEGLIPLLVDIFPAITARKAYQARQRLFNELVEFVKKEKYKQASELIQHRIRINLMHGFTTENAGQAELMMLWAIIANAVPTAFWLLVNIFSRPSLLNDLRQEVVNAVTEESGTRIIDVPFLKSSCPLLVSTYRETLRTISIAASIRVTLADTIISDKYLLKKDSIIQIAGGVLHADKDIWGGDADTFNPRRFIQDLAIPADAPSDPSQSNTASLRPEKKTSTAQQSSLPKNVPSAAFRAFGGGSVICPGRHFAQSEIVGFTAVMLLGFEITNPSGDQLTLPKKDESGLPLTVIKPAQGCRVKIRRREGMEGARWALKV